jgi:trehalose 6-phosphate synthase
MRRAIRFVVLLIIALALLTWNASRLVNGAARRWFERDMALRARLAINGARQGLISDWQNDDRQKVQSMLEELTHDERIIGAAACGPDGQLLTRTAEFPAELSCADIQPHVAQTPGFIQWNTWAETTTLPSGEVHVSAVPVLDAGTPLGFVVLVHDMRYIAWTESATRYFSVLGFAILALAASAITLIVARLSRRDWNEELRRLLRGGKPRPEFRPLLHDVRELADRIAHEKDADLHGIWNADRLRDVLRGRLEGERITVVANREPYIHERSPDGTIHVRHPASGVVTALEPIMRACSGVWIGHGSGSADHETADRRGRLPVPPDEGSYILRRVWLTPEEEAGYYYGFSNQGLWPLCHIAHTRPIFRGEEWSTYQTVNERFAEGVLDEVDTSDPIVLVQDYHFALLPAIIRRRLPRATILTFWHIPWPNPEQFGICPWRTELLNGLLGSSIIGFQTRVHCNNFLETVDRFVEARIDRDQNAVVAQSQTTLIRPYPISVEWPSRWTEQLPSAAECRASVMAELQLADNTLIGVGVDRLDYTKGIEERLLAVERLLDEVPLLQGRFVFVQLAEPSRTLIEQYQQLSQRVQQLVARINRRFRSGTYQPIVLLREHHEPSVVFRYYRAAHLCCVSSLHDGMNLVAKEFVSARDDEQGVLVLSLFAGAAGELTDALIVNPYDIGETSAALATALRMSPEEQGDRMRAMRAFLTEFNVYRWAGRMLVDAARIRQRDRWTHRLADRLWNPQLMTR